MTNVIYLTFDPDSNSYIGCGSDTSLDGMGISRYVNGLTYEFWIRPMDWGADDDSGGFLCAKGANFYIRLSASDSGVKVLRAGTSNWTSIVPFTLDDDWHHIAVTFHYNSPGDRYYHIFIDGTEGSYSTYTKGSSSVSDTSDNFLIGDYSGDGAYSFLGDIAWVRITQAVLYTTTFTPPDRCSIPTPDDDTVALWITEGTGTTTYNLGFATGNGAISNCTWGTESCGGPLPRWQVV